MKSYLISIGDELLIGQTVNTNAAFIGNKLADINFDIIRISIVKDNENDIIEELDLAKEKSDVIIITGGLGPTHDDVTKRTLVKYFNTELIENPDVLENIKIMFEKRGRKITPLNEQQALVPKIAKVISNDYGTAPGMWIEHEKKIYIIMPGVPYEMKPMMENFVIPELTEIAATEGLLIRRLILQTTGLPESTLYEKLGNLNELLGDAELAFLPSSYGVKLRITVRTGDEETAKNKLTEIEQKIRSKAGRYIFARGEERLEETVGRLLKERDLTISIAESCTGGNISNIITNVAGSSKYFERGVVSYSNAAKVEILKVDEDTVTKHGAVSQEVAMQMAEGIKSISGTDIGLSVTGILGPSGATTDKPVGLIYIGYCDEKVCTASKFYFGNDRLINKQRATQAALDILRRNLLGISQDD
ncbi:MAG: competence/damage-inducible protein A [Ignavibacteriaceae bacterium]